MLNCGDIDDKNRKKSLGKHPSTKKRGHILTEVMNFAMAKTNFAHVLGNKLLGINVRHFFYA